MRQTAVKCVSNPNDLTPSQVVMKKRSVRQHYINTHKDYAPIKRKSTCICFFAIENDKVMNGAITTIAELTAILDAALPPKEEHEDANADDSNPIDVSNPIEDPNP
eukprot:869716_1